MMENKYLLYIDVLDFTEIIKSLSKTEGVFKIIDPLNVHQHNMFKTIVFSDTVLVYNLFEPAQLENIDGYIQAKRKHAEYYNELLKNVDGIMIPIEKE